MRDYDKDQVLDILDEYLTALENEADVPPWSIARKHEVLLYSRYIWALESVRDEILKSSENPLMTIDHFRYKMKEYASIDEAIWGDCVDAIDELINRVV